VEHLTTDNCSPLSFSVPPIPSLSCAYILLRTHLLLQISFSGVVLLSFSSSAAQLHQPLRLFDHANWMELIDLAATAKKVRASSLCARRPKQHARVQDIRRMTGGHSTGVTRDNSSSTAAHLFSRLPRHSSITRSYTRPPTVPHRTVRSRARLMFIDPDCSVHKMTVTEMVASKLSYWLTAMVTLTKLSYVEPGRPSVGIGAMSTGDGFSHRWKKRRVLRSSGFCYQQCSHTGLLYAIVCMHDNVAMDLTCIFFDGKDCSASHVWNSVDSRYHRRFTDVAKHSSPHRYYSKWVSNKSDYSDMSLWLWVF